MVGLARSIWEENNGVSWDMLIFGGLCVELLPVPGNTLTRNLPKPLDGRKHGSTTVFLKCHLFA